jgi:hypothetical protein
MKDLEEAVYILGINIYRDISKRLIGLSQDAYIDKILNRLNMQDSKKCFLPMTHGITLSKNQYPSTPDEQERMRGIPYASAIGSIMYTVLCTYPHVSYALSVMSRYQSNYDEAHWTIIKNILKYFRRTKEVFFVFRSEEELLVTGYTDASFQIDMDDSKSQSSFMFCLNGGVVSWKSSKLDTVTDSMMEAEYIATWEPIKEVVFVRNFIYELGVVPSVFNHMDLYCDSSGAIAQTKESRSNKKSKHVLRHYHLIRKIINRGDVKVCKVHTDQNVVDLLTKPLPQP